MTWRCRAARASASCTMHHAVLAVILLAQLCLGVAFAPNALPCNYACAPAARVHRTRGFVRTLAATRSSGATRTTAKAALPSKRSKRRSTKPRVSADELQRAMTPRQAFLLYLEQNPILTELPPLEKDPCLPMVETIVRAADSKKAEDIAAYRVSNVTLGTNFFVFMNGHSRAHISGIQDEIERQMQLKHNVTALTEGLPKDAWMVIDFPNELSVHIMTPKMRGFYQLDRKWSIGGKVDVTPWLTPPDDFELQRQAAAQEEIDPFWS